MRFYDERLSNTRPIVRIKLLVQGEDGGDAADVVGELLGFVAREGAGEEGGLAVAERFLEDLVAAKGVVADKLGHVFPAGGGVEVDVEVASPRVPRWSSGTRKWVAGGMGMDCQGNGWFVARSFSTAAATRGAMSLSPSIVIFLHL
jgi:hypothetical protein